MRIEQYSVIVNGVSCVAMRSDCDRKRQVASRTVFRMEFPFEIELTVRYQDLDLLGHVNNTAYVTYLEQARIEYIDSVLGVRFDEWDMVIANLNVDYERQIDPDVESVRVDCGVVELGTSSLRMESNVVPVGWDEPAVTAEATLVALRDGAPREIPAAWRERIEAFEPGL